MTLITSTITIIKSTDQQFKLTLLDGITPIDLTGCTIFFTVKNTDDNLDSDLEASIAKRIETFNLITPPVDDPENGVMYILLTHTDTDIEPGEYRRDIRIKTQTGFVSSIRTGKFIVLQNTTDSVA